MNLFEIANYVKQNKHGTWSSASSQALLETEIFLAAQNGEDDFLWNHPIRILDSDGAHESFQRRPTNPLSWIDYYDAPAGEELGDGYTLLEFSNTPDLIRPNTAWTAASNWVVSAINHGWNLTFDYTAFTPEASNVSCELSGLVVGVEYDVLFTVSTLSANTSVQLYLDNTAIGDAVVASSGTPVERSFTPTATTHTFRFYGAAVDSGSDIVITDIEARTTVAESEYTLLARFGVNKPLATTGDEIGYSKTTQSDGSTDSANMPTRWAALSQIYNAEGTHGGGGGDVTNYYMEFSSLGYMACVGSYVLSQVPDSEKEFPGQMRDSLAMYALSVIEKNSNQGKSDLLRSQVLQMWMRVKRLDAIETAAEWEQGGSPYAG